MAEGEGRKLSYNFTSMWLSGSTLLLKPIPPSHFLTLTLLQSATYFQLRSLDTRLCVLNKVEFNWGREATMQIHTRI